MKTSATAGAAGQQKQIQRFFRILRFIRRRHSTGTEIRNIPIQPIRLFPDGLSTELRQLRTVPGAHGAVGQQVLFPEATQERLKQETEPITTLNHITQ